MVRHICIRCMSTGFSSIFVAISTPSSKQAGMKCQLLWSVNRHLTCNSFGRTGLPLSLPQSSNHWMKDCKMMSQLSQLRRFKVFPQHKHNMHPDTLYVVQRKSSIFDIVPSPRHLGKDISYPCIVKVDMSSDGIGNRLAKNEGELTATLRQIRDVCHWKGEIVFQEFIPGVKEVLASNFICTNRGNYFGSAQLREHSMEFWIGPWER